MSFASQLSAFSYKNIRIFNSRKGFHVLILLVLPLLIVLSTIITFSNVRNFRVSDFNHSSKEHKFSRIHKIIDSEGIYNKEIYWDKDKVPGEIPRISIKKQPLKVLVFKTMADNEELDNVEQHLKLALDENLLDSPLFKTFSNFEEFQRKDEKDNFVKEAEIRLGVHGLYPDGAIILDDSSDRVLSLRLVVNRNDSLINYLKLMIFRALANNLNVSMFRIDKSEENAKSLGFRFLAGFICSYIKHFSLILFTNLLISEKEDKMFVLMRLNGLTVGAYIFANMFFYFLFILVPTALGLLILVIEATVLLSPSQWSIVLLTELLSSFEVLAFAFVLSFVFKRAIFSNIFCNILTLFTYPNLGAQVYNKTQLAVLPKTYVWVPVFGGPLSTAYITVFTNRSFGDLVRLPIIWHAVLSRAVFTAILLVLCFYFFNVIDMGYSGMARPWYYPITYLLEFFNEKKNLLAIERSIIRDPSLIDDDVRHQMQLVDQDFDSAIKNHALVFQHVSKVYKGGKLAVEDVTMALKGDQIFALLGPNGAGKTTLMHVTAGLYEANTGRVVLDGKDSRLDRDAYFRHIGFCPQHDIYWKSLTCAEHLRFFELLRGGSSVDLERKINETLAGVKLHNYANTKAMSLSGGERRRLSLAMALSGESKVVLLDEPTTGLDPKVRRLIWDIINECRNGRLMILTTHSMEEAETLSLEITIMAHGRLKCFGTAKHLKAKFGGQIYLNFETQAGQFDQCIEGIKARCPEGTEVTIVSESSEKLSGRLLFKGKKEQVLKLIKSLLEARSQIGLKTFGVVQSSLDDVFMNIVREQDADA